MASVPEVPAADPRHPFGIGERPLSAGGPGLGTHGPAVPSHSSARGRRSAGLGVGGSGSGLDEVCLTLTLQDHTGSFLSGGWTGQPSFLTSQIDAGPHS